MAWIITFAWGAHHSSASPSDSLRFIQTYDSLTLLYGTEPTHAHYLDSAWYLASEGEFGKARAWLDRFGRDFWPQIGLPDVSARRSTGSSAVAWQFSTYCSMHSFDDMMYREKLDSAEADTLDTLAYRSFSGDVRLRSTWKRDHRRLSEVVSRVSLSTSRVATDIGLSWSLVPEMFRGVTELHAESRVVGGRFDSLPGAGGGIDMVGRYPMGDLFVVTPECRVAVKMQRYLHNTVGSVSSVAGVATPRMIFEYQPWALVVGAGWKSGIDDYEQFEDFQGDKRFYGPVLDYGLSVGCLDLSGSAGLSYQEYPSWRERATYVYPAESRSIDADLWFSLGIMTSLNCNVSAYMTLAQDDFPNYRFTSDGFDDSIAAVWHTGYYAADAELRASIGRVEYAATFRFEQAIADVRAALFRDSLLSQYPERIYHSFVPGLEVSFPGIRERFTVAAGANWRFETVEKDLLDTGMDFMELELYGSTRVDIARYLSLRGRLNYYRRLYGTEAVTSTGLSTSLSITVDF